MVRSSPPRLLLCDKIFRLYIKSAVYDPMYLVHCLASTSVRQQIESAISGAEGLANNLPQSVIRGIQIEVPSLKEQKAITKFLDRKVQSVDLIINKKEQLNALLLEERHSIIGLAVTSGPAVRLGQAIRERQRPVSVGPNKTYTEIGVRSHGRGIFHKESQFGWQLDEKKVFWIEPGDLVFNIVFAWERAVAVASPAEAGLIGSHRFPTFRPIADRADVRYLKYLFISDFGRFLLDQNSPGAAGRNRTLDRRSLLKEKVPLPEIARQREIANMLDQKCAAIDRATASLLVSIQKLKEYRQALITAAVTGQIDVTREDARDAG